MMMILQRFFVSRMTKSCLISLWKETFDLPIATFQLLPVISCYQPLTRPKMRKVVPSMVRALTRETQDLSMRKLLRN